MSLLEDLKEMREENLAKRRNDPDRSEKSGFPLGAIIGIGVLALLFVYLFCTATVDPGYEGVVVNQFKGGVQDIPMTQGMHWKTPFIESVKPIQMQTLIYERDAAASSKDQQDVTAKVALNYHIAEGTAPLLYQKIGVGYADIVIRPGIEEATKAATARYTAAELTTKRPLVKNEITEDLTKRLIPYNIVVETVSLTNLSFSPTYTAAIEAKQVAEQRAQQAERDLQRIGIEAQQIVVTAGANANATKLQADADAYNIQKLGEAINKNPDVAKLKWIEKWDGAQPFYVMGDGASTTMMINPSA